METTILKIVLCSSILIAVYYLFLEREKILKFNRLYLLFSLVFSYAVPFISITVPSYKEHKPQLVFEEAVQNVLASPAKEVPVFNWESLLWLVYGIITTILLVRSLISIFSILNLEGKSQTINSIKVRILDKNSSPFSFMNTIYVGKNYLKNNKIDERIFLHEKNHIEQKHSYDLIFVEILKIFTWFNPAIYLYKKAITTNHEFLADESVLSKNFEVKAYQSLIFEEIANHQNLNFTHQFNFNNTKKRFIMMTKTKTKFSGMKQIMSIPIFSVLFVLFVQKVYSQSEIDKNVDNPNEKFQKILQKHTSLLQEKKYEEFLNSFTNEEKYRLNELFSQLTPTQKEKSPIVVFNKTGTSEKNARAADSVIKNEIGFGIKEEYIKKAEQKQIDTAKPLSTNIETNLISPPMTKQQLVDYQKKDTSSESPQFPGGTFNFRGKIIQDFDTSKFLNKKGLNATVISFDVNKLGMTSNFKVEGRDPVFNQEALKAVKKIAESETWAPAMKDGNAVDFVYKLPITMNFQ